MPEHPNILLLSTDKTETAVLQELLRGYATLTLVRNLSDLRCLLEGDSSYGALLCAWSFHTGTWHEALSKIHESRPDLPVIIFSRYAAEREWIEVLEAGAFDLLAVPPHEEREFLAVLEQASATRQARVSKGVEPRARKSA